MILRKAWKAGDWTLGLRKIAWFPLYACNILTSHSSAQEDADRTIQGNSLRLEPIFELSDLIDEDRCLDTYLP